MAHIERQPEGIGDKVFDGLHVNRTILDREWIHGRLSLDGESKRSRLVRSHLNMCKVCREREREIRQKDRDEDWGLAQLPEGDRD